MLKKIAIKILMFCLVIIALNFIYEFTLYKKDLKEKCQEAIQIKNSTDSTDIYYFGESSNFTYREADSIKNSISEITNFFFPTLRIRSINKPATHAGIYKNWLTQINTGSKKPKAIIITLNMRSFDAMWVNSSLETQLQESMVLIQPYPKLINRFFLSLQIYDHRSDKEREQVMLKDWDTTKLVFPFEVRYKTVREWNEGVFLDHYYKKEDGSKDVDKTLMALHYIKAYAINIKDNNKRTKDFDAIANWCNKNGISLYMNLMAENIEYADSLVGKELVFLMKQNRDFLVKRYQKNNCVVVDNLELVPGKEFIDQNWTTEHYGYKGRMTIAKNLAKVLNKQFSKEYKNAY